MILNITFIDAVHYTHTNISYVLLLLLITRVYHVVQNIRASVFDCTYIRSGTASFGDFETLHRKTL